MATTHPLPRPCSSALRMLLIVMLVGLCMPAALRAATFYVATTGNDSRSCATAQTITTPKLTIASGLACLAGGGDTLLIRGGTYSGQDISTDNGLAASGTSWATPITISGFSGETVIARNAGIGVCGYNYIIFKDFSLTGGQGGAGVVCDTGSATAGDSYIRFQNLDIYGYVGLNHGYYIFANHVEILGGKVHDANPGTACDVPAVACHGIYMQGSFNLIDGVEFYNVPGYCIHQYTGYANTPNNDGIIRNNIVHDCGIPTTAAAGGIITAGGGPSSATNNLVYNNIVYSVPLGSGIDVAYGNTNSKIYNNTVYNVGGSGVNIGSSDCTGNVVQNNILYVTGSPSINDVGSGNTKDHNLTTNPSFVNAGAADFHLQAGSTAINTGVTLAAVPVDIAGGTRPQGGAYDIGAYEFGAGGGGLPLAAPTNLRVIFVP